MVNFRFYESLTEEQAREELQVFLEIERKAVSDLIGEAEKGGLAADYSLASLPNVLKWGVTLLNTVPKEPDLSIPEYIRETESYKRGLYEFDEPSIYWLLRFAYYSGECFIRSSDKLKWDIGNRDTMEQNMPVVTAFKYGIEFAPLMIVENLFSAMKQGAPNCIVDEAISGWLGDMP